MKKAAKRTILLLLSVLVLALILIYGVRTHGVVTKWKLPVGSMPPAVSIGDNHGVILASDGSLWTWGETGFGWQVLGLGSNVRTQAWLRRIGLETNWINVAVGGSTTLALKSDGTIWAWGENIYGQLGAGSRVSESAIPVPSAPGSDWKQVACAGPHSLALKRNGTLWSWGNNWAGQLGDGSTNYSRAPIQVGSSTNWTHIWADLIQNVAQQADGSLWFWGWDYSRSQAGASIPVPTRVSSDTNWVSVGMGDWMVFAVKSDGTLWAWGRLAHIYTGAATGGGDGSPVRVGTDSDWLACSHFSHSSPLFMKRDGSIWLLDASDSRGVAAVTAIVTGLITNNQLTIVADSTTLGGDPAFGVVKSLQINFQLGGTSGVQTFKENAPVNLGGNGQTLTVMRALYGDPALFADANRAVTKVLVPSRLRRIQVPNDIVSFCGGPHGLGVVLTSTGEVWTWGEALGRHTLGFPPLQFCSRVLNHLGVQVHLGEPGPVILKEPTRLEIEQGRR